ncbi:hypothetical protein OIE66_02080 [Nonomuraea sp. NBC_01738]|uniref:hypothetical protein n=1 Tax=Nonomuraea sp. NBC_01738 TaxID=2976003 RepID=UPI002E121388|nr:hypothetical protein OIE66_02080 [Nonomuraea sp. NBC_01738]
MRAGIALTAALLTLVAGCGITESGVVELGGPPLVSIPPPSKTIYMLRDGKLILEPADVDDDSVNSLLTALFAASAAPLPGRETALRGFTYEGMNDTTKRVQRNDPQLPRTSTLTVYVKGEQALTRSARAQIVCTAQQDAAYEAVKIVHKYDRRAPTTEEPKICGDLKD